MSHETSVNFFPIIRGQENNIILDTKAIIETHVADNAVIINPRG